MRRLLPILALLCLALPAKAATPVVVNWGCTPDLNNTGQALTTAMTAHVPLMRNTTTGDTIVVLFRYENGTGWSISDGTNTYTRGVNGTGNGWTLDSYYSVNITGGTRNISITHTTTSAVFLSACAIELNNVTAFHLSSTCATGAGNGIDQNTSSTAASGSISPASGDEIVYYNFTETGPILTTAYAPVSHANVTWQLIAGQMFAAQALMVGQYNSATAFAPSMTQGTNGSFDWSACSMAFTTGTSGASGLPSGENVLGSQAETWQSGAGTTPVMELTPRGNALLGIGNSGGTEGISGISSSPSVTWTVGSICSDSGNNVTSQYFYASGLTPGTSYTLTITLTNSVSDEALQVFDLNGAGSLDTGTQGGCNSGNFAATSGVLDTSLTTGGGAAGNKPFGPSIANGIIVSGISNSFDTVTATTTVSPALLANGWLSGATQTGNTPFYENDGWLTYVNSSTSNLAIKYTYTASPPNTSTNVAQWASVAVNVKPAASATSIPRRRFGVF